MERVRLQLKSQEKNRKNELTLRELDVLKLLSEGKSTQEIAQELCVSANTVDTHRRHLMENWMPEMWWIWWSLPYQGASFRYVLKRRFRKLICSFVPTVSLNVRDYILINMCMTIVR